jgi:phosphatidylglycerophosphate synthase
MTRAVIVVSHPVAHERFCGRTLVERHETLLRAAGVTAIAVVDAANTDSAGRGWHDTRFDRTIGVTAERLFDPRLYAAILAADAPARITDGGEEVGLRTMCDVGRHGADNRDVDAIPAERSIEIASLDPYSRELRRSLPPYWMRVTGIDDRPAVTRLLVEASGKGHQDLPAMLLNAPLEMAAMRRLANTGVTPNQLTGLCNLMAYAVAALLASGHLLAGAMGAIAVGVVDGLDGRQARVQLRTTPLGRLEHLLDKIYEVLWIVALAYALSGHFADRAYVTPLLIWIAAYLLDTAAYDIVKWRTGATLDEASRLDAAIRLVAGRRNVYACMFLVGVIVGQPAAAFHAIVSWSVVTAAVHGARAALVVGNARPRVLV